MILLRNIVFFFVLFLPAAFLTGFVCDFFVGPRPAPRAGYEIMRFISSVLPLLAPSLLMVPVLHFAQRRWLAHSPYRRALMLSIVTTPLALLVPHLVLYGDRFLSVPLVVLFAIPGALYGAALFPVRDIRTFRGSGLRDTSGV